MDFSALISLKESIPTNYTWSGYANNVSDFVNSNFKVSFVDNHDVYLCSVENGVALGDYLSRYFHLSCMEEIENELSPGYSYWFFQAFERCETNYSELDDWFKEIVELLISKGLILKQKTDNLEFFALLHFNKYEKSGLPENIVSEINGIGKKTLDSIRREKCLDLLHTNDFQYIEPPIECKDVGFTERPIWINSKGYGYVYCDESIASWEGNGLSQEKWGLIKKKINEKTLTFDDIEGTSLEEMLEIIYGGFDVEEHEDDFSEIFDGLLSLPDSSPKHLYCCDGIDGIVFYESKEEFDKAYIRDYCDTAWDDLSNEELTIWVTALKEENILNEDS